MLRAFLKYYLLIVLCLISIIIAADYSFRQWQAQTMSPTLNVEHTFSFVKSYCQQSQCQANTKLPFGKVRLYQQSALALPVESKQRLQQGHVLSVIGEQQQIYYYQQMSQQLVIELGPFQPAKEQGYGYTSAFYLLLCLIILLGLYPIFADMRRLKDAATHFSQHKDFSQFSLSHSRYFQPVYDAIDWMVRRIARLLALQKELSDTLSHELRTSLSRLKFTLASLNDEKHLATKKLLKEDIKEIEQLINEYLSFSKQEHETPVLDMTQQSLIPVVEHYVSRLGQFSDKQVTTDFSNAVDASMDLTSISRAVKNLIDNALKYADSKIHIRIYQDAQDLVLQVDDDGVGLVSDKIDDLFLPYTRNHSDVPGYGLGLAITRKIVDWHHGSIAAKASNLMTGASFIMRIPIHVDVILSK